MYKYKDILYERIYVNVDSRQRSVNKYPESNSFRLNNSDKYTNVIYAKLLTAETPNTDYNVNEYNNHITFIDDGTTYTVELPIGDYTLNDLKVQLDLAINSVGASNTYTFDIQNGKLIITGGGGTLPYQFLFRTGPFSDRIVSSSDFGDTQVVYGTDARTVLGFAIADYTSDVNDQIISPYKVDLAGDSYIMLEFGPSSYKFNKTHALDQITRDKFYKIQLAAPQNTINFLTEDQLEHRTIVFPEPIPIVRDWEIKYWTYRGNLYNFRGFDNSFTVEIGVLINQKY